MIRVYGSGNPIGETDIDQLEQDLGHVLPFDYRDFLLKYNGGYVDLDRFAYMEDGRERTGGVHRFFSVSDSQERFSIQRNITAFNPKEVPSNLLPIAEDAVGNFIFMSIFGHYIGKIYYWKHEYHPDDGNIFYVADSFTEFLNKLFKHDDEED